jgi:tryptophan halogenase
VQGNVNGIELRDGGFIRAVQLQGGREIEADLFVDASGPRAVLRGELDAAFESWSAWLAADTLELQLGAADPRPTVLDGNRAIASGWTWTASSARDSSRGHVTSSAFVEADGPGERLSFRQGRRPQPWLRNCVAVGDAAVAVEPLEWTNLHLAHSAIDRLVSMMPDKDCAPVELAEFNRQCGDEANRVRDFLCLHYAAGPPELGPFWRDATTREIPPSLAHTLAMFRERGRLPFYEEETFERDSWLTVLLCQGVRPRRIDPLTDLITPAETARALTALAEQANAGLGQPAPQRVTEGRFER